MPAVLTRTGRSFLVQQLGGIFSPAVGTTPGYIGVGTGAGSASISSTALYTEVLPRLAAALTTLTTVSTGDTLSAVVTIHGPLVITNAGLFDSATGGNLFVITDFDGTAINLGPNDQLILTFLLIV